MERLPMETLESIIGIQNTTLEAFEKHGSEDSDYCPAYDKAVLMLLEELKQNRIAEEQGLLLRLPCKVGDTLWWVDAFGDLCSSAVNSMFVEQGIDGIVIETWVCNVNGKEIGKTAFLTKEEAEQALAKMKEV